MSKRITLRSTLVGLFALSLLIISAYSQNARGSAALSGNNTSVSNTHQRQAVGIES